MLQSRLLLVIYFIHSSAYTSMLTLNINGYDDQILKYLLGVGAESSRNPVSASWLSLVDRTRCGSGGSILRGSRYVDSP